MGNIVLQITLISFPDFFFGISGGSGQNKSSYTLCICLLFFMISIEFRVVDEKT